MDCRDFRDRHLAFVDNALPEAELVAMQRHIAECGSCERHDSAVRRGLLIFRNLPTIEPSPDFASRLNARIRQLHQADARAAMYRGPGVTSFIAAAAMVVAVGFFAVAAFDWDQPARDLALAPVVATLPEAPPSPILSHTLVATATAGLPSVWPAAMLAEQAPVHFVHADMRLAAWGRE